MKRRDFLQTMGAAAASGMVARVPLGSPPKKLQRIGLETYAVRHAMAENPEQTLAAVHAMGFTDVELLWSFNFLGRRAAEEIERPEQLHVGVAHRVHRGEGLFGILRHGVANRVRLETDALQLLGA